MKKLFLRAEFGPLWEPWEEDEIGRKEFPNKIKEFAQYSKIKEFPNKIKEFSNQNKTKIK